VRLKHIFLIAIVVLALGSTVVIGRLFGPGFVAHNPLTPQQSSDGPGCQPDHPSFYYGFADLHARLGAVMGNPTECEHSIHANGDTRQQTTAGYAYYRKSDNVPTFTNGWDHWALTDRGLVHWSGYVVDPPSADAEASE